MKIQILLVSIISLFVSSVYSQTEQPTSPPYEGYQICVNSTAEHYWVYGKGGKHGKGFYHDFHGWQFVSYDEQTHGNVLDVSGDFDKITIRTNKDKILSWKSNNNRWTEYKGITGIKDFSRHGNDIYVVGKVTQADGSSKVGIFKALGGGQRPSDWIPVLTDGKGSATKRFDITDKGIIWACDGNGAIFNTNTAPNGVTYGTYQQPLQNIKIKDIYICGDAIYAQATNTRLIKLVTNPQLKYEDLNFAPQSWAVSSNGNVYAIVDGKIEKSVNGTRTTLSVPNPNRILADGSTPLIKSMNEFDYNGFNAAITDGSNVNAVDKDGNPPIVIAVKKHNVSFMGHLIANKADVNKPDKSGYTALYYACQQNDDLPVKTLLEHGADPNQKGIVDAALKNPRGARISMLAEKNADFSKGYLMAIQNNDLMLFKSLGKAGVKQNGMEVYKKVLDYSNAEMAGLCIEYGTNADSALKYTLQRNKKEIIGVCLDKGAKPGPAVIFAVNKNDMDLCYQLMNRPDISPDMILDEALSKTNGSVNIAIAGIALQSGAEPNKHIKNAVASDQKDVVDLLFENSADPNLVLTESVNYNKIEYAQLAVNKGASIFESTLVLIAIDKKNKDMVSLLIDAGGDATDPVLISKSVSNNDIEMTQLLISQGAYATDPDLILTAVNAKNLEMTQLLIDNGASTSDVNLIIASVTNKDIEMSKLLIMNGAYCTDPVIIRIAVAGNDLQTCELLLANGAEASEPSLIMHAVKSNDTPLVELLLNNNAPVSGEGLVSEAVGHRNLQIVTLLIEKGADPNDGIATAVSKNYTVIAIYLLDNKAVATDPELMEQASRFGNLAVVQKLRSNGADVNNGTIPAIEKQHVDVLNYLVSEGADMSTPEYMYKAVFGNYSKIYEIVESAGAPNTWKGDNGDNLLHVSARKMIPSLTIISKLANSGVDINAKNNDGDTPLLVALYDGKNEVEMCKALVTAGADVNITNRKNKTPRKVARGGKVKGYLKSVGGKK